MVRQVKSFAMGAFLMFVGMGLVYGAPFVARSIVPASDRADIADDSELDDPIVCEHTDFGSPDEQDETGGDPQECETDGDQDADDDGSEKDDEASEDEDEDSTSGDSDDKGEHGRAVRIVAHCDVSGKGHGELVRSIATNKSATVADAEAACADAMSSSEEATKTKPSHDDRRPKERSKGHSDANADGDSGKGSDHGSDHDDSSGPTDKGKATGHTGKSGRSQAGSGGGKNKS